MPELDPQDPPRKAIGKAIPRSPSEIARISQVSDGDIVKARGGWKRRSSDPYKGLIEAELEQENDGPDA